MWRGMAALASGNLLLLVLPVLSRRLPAFGRVYDAKEHVTLFRQWRSKPAAGAALGLIAYLGALMLLTLLGNSSVGVGREFLVGVLVAVLALGAFEFLVRTSRAYVEEQAPVLPDPGPAPAAAPTGSVSQ
jgi:hypothetical protein